MSEHWADHTTVDLGPIRMTVPELWEFTRHYTALAARRRVHRWLGRPGPADSWAKPTAEPRLRSSNDRRGRRTRATRAGLPTTTVRARHVGQ